MSIFTRGLNQSQAAAVNHSHGPLLVLAGAGSGKTRVLTNRIARLVHDKICKPSQILAVTFTNKAAEEMRQRVAEQVSAQAAKVMTIATFHSLGAQILREEGAGVGIQPRFTIVDDHQRQATIKEVIRAVGTNKDKDELDKIGTTISLAKNASLAPDDYAEHNPDERRMSRIYKAYRLQLLKRQSVDFDDLLLLPLQLFEQKPDVLAKYRNKFQFISIDEFQDTNTVQLKLARLLAAPANNILAVGDDDQGIYSWRGADINNILSFQTHFPGCTRIVLDVNYRSTRQILDAAMAVVGKNTKRTPKEITAAAGDGDPIRLVKCDDETEEADWICQTIQQNVAERHCTFADHALLMRTNAMLRRFEEAMRRHKIPYKVFGAISFFERKEIKDILAYLRFFANERDELSLQRVLKVPDRGIAPSTMERLDELAGFRRINLWEAFARHADIDGLSALQHQKLDDFLDFHRRYQSLFAKGELSATLRRILDECNYSALLERASKDEDAAEMRRENVEEIVRGLEMFETKFKQRAPTLAAYLQELSLVMNDTSEDEEQAKDRGVRLLTLHKSKGLEFPLVFLCNLDDSMMPSPRAIAEGGIEEERRLFYVGMTRARKQLYLTYPASKEFRKKTMTVTPCRFLTEIPEEFLDGSFSQKRAEQEAEAQADFFAKLRQKFSAPVDTRVQKQDQ